MANANEKNTPATEPTKPIVVTLKDSGEQWTLDFNRRSLGIIVDKPDLAKTLDTTVDIGDFTRTGMWMKYMPQIISVASMMHHRPQMSLSTAEDIYKQLGNKTAAFCARMTMLYATRMAEANGLGNEDLAEDAEDEGNVSWE